MIVVLLLAGCLVAGYLYARWLRIRQRRVDLGHSMWTENGVVKFSVRADLKLEPTSESFNVKWD